MRHGVPWLVSCGRVGCRDLPTERFSLCRLHWLEFVMQAFRHGGTAVWDEVAPEGEVA